MTAKRKILFIDPAHPYLENHLVEIGFSCDHMTGASLTDILAVLPNYFGVVIRSRFNVDKTFLDKGSQLAFIARIGIGLEHIDEVYATKKGIAIFNSPEGSRDAVGEHALGLLLNLLNNINKSDREVRNGQWIREGNRGVEIKGKTVGIIGYGNTGSTLARRLAGFEATVIAYDKYKKDYGDAFAEAVSLETVFRKADFVSIHIPYMESNHYFINDTFLSNFDKNIFLVNTARGLVLNTADLVEHLKSGKILGAALDVIEYEEASFASLELDDLPEPFQFLRQANNVILTPHIAGWSFAAREGHAKVLSEKIEKFIFDNIASL